MPVFLDFNYPDLFNDFTPDFNSLSGVGATAFGILILDEITKEIRIGSLPLLGFTGWERMKLDPLALQSVDGLATCGDDLITVTQGGGEGNLFYDLLVLS
jgi:hypothetical protein